MSSNTHGPDEGTGKTTRGPSNSCGSLSSNRMVNLTTKNIARVDTQTKGAQHLAKVLPRTSQIGTFSACLNPSSYLYSPAPGFSYGQDRPKHRPAPPQLLPSCLESALCTGEEYKLNIF